MVLIEIDRSEARKRAIKGQTDGTREAIKAGFFMIWTPERIKHAFNYGHGTRADFERYRRDNIPYCIIQEISEKELAFLYPEY